MATARHVTRAVVLRTFRHTDRNVILKALTERFGPRSYMVRSGGRGGTSPALLEPLARVELVVGEEGERDLQRLFEVRVRAPYQRVPVDPVRRAMALFVQEVFYQALRQDAPDQRLFTHVDGQLEALDAEGLDPAHYPLRLLLGLAEKVGIFPQPREAAHEHHFDPREGHFIPGPPPHVDCFEEALSDQLAAWIDAWPDTPRVRATAVQRRALLDGLLVYFRLHLPGFGRLHSPEILHAVLH